MIIKQVYDVGYAAREGERDYDPLASDTVCEVIRRWERLHKLAEQVAHGNFNQAKVIAEARALLELKKKD